jgi:hypothetical protein
MKMKYFLAVSVLIIYAFLISCSAQKREICGSWESVLIENRSSLFDKTLPSSAKGEVLLTISEDKKFTWINNTEKLNLTGKYRSEGDKIYFSIDGETNPLYVKFKLRDNKLIITTEDEFIFTFIRRY